MAVPWGCRLRRVDLCRPDHSLRHGPMKLACLNARTPLSWTGPGDTRADPQSAGLPFARIGSDSLRPSAGLIVQSRRWP